MIDYRLAIVTGGARGLGLAMVTALLDQDVVDRAAVFHLLDEPVDDGRVSVHRCDVTDADSVRAAYHAVGDDQDLGVLDGAGELVEKSLLPMARRMRQC